MTKIFSLFAFVFLLLVTDAFAQTARPPLVVRVPPRAQRVVRSRLAIPFNPVAAPTPPPPRPGYVRTTPPIPQVGPQIGPLEEAARRGDRLTAAAFREAADRALRECAWRNCGAKWNQTTVVNKPGLGSVRVDCTTCGTRVEAVVAPTTPHPVGTAFGPFPGPSRAVSTTTSGLGRPTTTSGDPMPREREIARKRLDEAKPTLMPRSTLRGLMMRGK